MHKERYQEGQWAQIIPHITDEQDPFVRHPNHIGIYTETSDRPIFFCLTCLREVSEHVEDFVKITPRFDQIEQLFLETRDNSQSFHPGKRVVVKRRGEREIVLAAHTEPREITYSLSSPEIIREGDTVLVNEDIKIDRGYSLKIEEGVKVTCMATPYFNLIDTTRKRYFVKVKHIFQAVPRSENYRGPTPSRWSDFPPDKPFIAETIVDIPLSSLSLVLPEETPKLQLDDFLS